MLDLPLDPVTHGMDHRFDLLRRPRADGDVKCQDKAIQLTLTLLTADACDPDFLHPLHRITDK